MRRHGRRNRWEILGIRWGAVWVFLYRRGRRHSLVHNGGRVEKRKNKLLYFFTLDIDILLMYSIIGEFAHAPTIFSSLQYAALYPARFLLKKILRYLALVGRARKTGCSERDKSGSVGAALILEEVVQHLPQTVVLALQEQELAVASIRRNSRRGSMACTSSTLAGSFAETKETTTSRFLCLGETPDDFSYALGALQNIVWRAVVARVVAPWWKDRAVSLEAPPVQELLQAQQIANKLQSALRALHSLGTLGRAALAANFPPPQVNVCRPHRHARSVREALARSQQTLWDLFKNVWRRAQREGCSSSSGCFTERLWRSNLLRTSSGIVRGADDAPRETGRCVSVQGVATGACWSPLPPQARSNEEVEVVLRWILEAMAGFEERDATCSRAGLVPTSGEGESGAVGSSGGAATSSSGGGAGSSCRLKTGLHDPATQDHALPLQFLRDATRYRGATSSKKAGRDAVAETVLNWARIGFSETGSIVTPMDGGGDLVGCVDETSLPTEASHPTKRRRVG